MEWRKATQKADSGFNRVDEVSASWRLVGVSAPEAYSSTLYSLQYFRILRRGRQCINHVQKEKVLSRLKPPPGAPYQKEPSDVPQARNASKTTQRKQPSGCWRAGDRGIELLKLRLEQLADRLF